MPCILFIALVAVPGLYLIIGLKLVLPRKLKHAFSKWRNERSVHHDIAQVTYESVIAAEKENVG